MRSEHRTSCYDRLVGLPPRPKDRPLVRRAVVASMLVAAGCDQGVKRSTPPQVPERHQVVAPQVAPPEPPHDNPEVAIAPQVAYANGFTLELVDVKGKPVVGVKAKVTINVGEAFEVTTSERGDAYVTTRIDGGETMTIEAEGYAPVENVTIEGNMSPSLRVVLKKKRR
jgi:hypothetical protein